MIDAIRSLHSDLKTHIQPLILWQCACGICKLPKRDYDHIMDCRECERLATEIGEALEDLEKGLRANRTDGTGS